METAVTINQKRTRAQHYVPQFYLRGFAKNERMYCYDKYNDRVYPTCTRDAAQESDFYEIPSTSQQAVPDNLVEKALAAFEAAWAPVMAKLIQAAKVEKVTCELLLEFSPFLAIQMMRTKLFRESLFELAMKYGQELVNDLLKPNFPGQEGKVRFAINKSDMAALQAQYIFDDKVVQKIADGLDRHIWVVGINHTDQPFYTSDHPIARRGHRMIGPRLGVGINDRGVEFVFPLDSKHILLIMERTHFAEWRKHDNKAIHLTPAQIRDYNELQVKRCSQRIYCEMNSFDLAREICAAEPSIRDPNRARVTVGSTPLIKEGDDMKNHIYITALE